MGRLIREYTELFDGGALAIHDAMNLHVDHAVRDVLLNLTATAEVRSHLPCAQPRCHAPTPRCSWVVLHWVLWPVVHTPPQQSDFAASFDPDCDNLGSLEAQTMGDLGPTTCPAWLNEARQRLERDARAAFEARLAAAFSVPPLTLERQRFMDVFEEDLEMGLDMAMGASQGACCATPRRVCSCPTPSRGHGL